MDRRIPQSTPELRSALGLLPLKPINEKTPKVQRRLLMIKNREALRDLNRHIQKLPRSATVTTRGIRKGIRLTLSLQNDACRRDALGDDYLDTFHYLDTAAAARSRYVACIDAWGRAEWANMHRISVDNSRKARKPALPG